MGIAPWATAGVVVAGLALLVACGGEPGLELTQEQLHAMPLTAEDLPPGFRLVKTYLAVGDVPTPQNIHVELESAQPPVGPGDIGCVTSELVVYSSPGDAAKAVRRTALPPQPVPGVPSTPGTTEKLDPPDIGDETAAAFLASPFYGTERCGSRWTSGVTAIAFSRDEIFVSLRAYTAEGKPPSDQVWEIARKQLDRVERVLGAVAPEEGGEQ